MSDESHLSDWKLKLRYGKLETPYTHYTAFADGYMRSEDNEFGCPVGPAIMALKTWALDTEQSADMIRSIGEHIGFEAKGKVDLYETEPEQPPSEKPSGYDANFTPYDE